MPAKGQFGNRRLLVCPCGNTKMVRASYTRGKYCSFPCYLKYTNGYDHKALGYRHNDATKKRMSQLAKEREITDVQRKAYALREQNLSEEERARRIDILNANRPTGPMSYSLRQKLSEIRTGKGYGGAYNYRGGIIGDAFAAILCPQGYIREYEWQYGTRCQDRFMLDFGHPEAKVCFELDGPGHYNTPQEDFERDTILKHFGWRVIRIRHD